jgi:HNH endonuclease
MDGRWTVSLIAMDEASFIRIPPKRELLWLKGGKKCHWCGQPTRLCQEFDWDQATTDHILPRYKGGSDDESNLVSACRLCNNRRSHEDAKGLAEGSLLGNYKPKSSGANSPKGRFIALSGEEKKAIMAGQYSAVVAGPVSPAGTRSLRLKGEEVLREQRDQAMREIGRLRTENAMLKGMAQQYKKRLNTMTFRRLLLLKVIRWLKRPEEK